MGVPRSVGANSPADVFTNTRDVFEATLRPSMLALGGLVPASAVEASAFLRPSRGCASGRHLWAIMLALGGLVPAAASEQRISRWPHASGTQVEWLGCPIRRSAATASGPRMRHSASVDWCAGRRSTCTSCRSGTATRPFSNLSKPPEGDVPSSERHGGTMQRCAVGTVIGWGAPSEDRRPPVQEWLQTAVASKHM